MRILHLVSDDKFIDFTKDVFDFCAEGKNTFYVLVGDESAPLRHVRDSSGMRIIGKRALRSRAVAESLKEFGAIIVHNLDYEKAVLLLQAPPELPVLWSGWGNDYYCFLREAEHELLGDESAELHRRLLHRNDGSTEARPLKIWAKDLFRPLYHKMIRRTELILHQAIRRCDYFSAPIPDDYPLLSSEVGGILKAEYLQINYGSVERTFAPGPPAVTGSNILIGNSASFTNNHCEIFRRLAALQIPAERIVVPLSYGHPAYRKAVVQRGYEVFGERFHPLMDFMPLDQYNALIASCSVVIMGHRRQQALGNTATMLYKGAKVFLDERSTVYTYLKREGAIVFGLGELAEEGVCRIAPLAPEQRAVNKEVLKGLWGHSVVVHRTRVALETLHNHKARATA